MTEPRYTALRDRHDALGASFTDFGGWMMPVRYTSDLAEHHAVRSAAGLFDISHMAEFVVTGADAGAFLDYALAGRLSALAIGKAKYSLVLAEDGGIIDDVIVYRLADEYYLVIANAGNHAAVASALAAARTSFPSPEVGTDAAGGFGTVGGAAVRVEDASDTTALIAVQGPRSRDVLDAVDRLELSDPARRPGDPATPWTFDDLAYYAARTALFDGTPVLIARTGYTGENGYELAIAADRVGALWDAVMDAGAPLGLVPAGLAARDTLRLEAGMPLYGHELSRDIVPAQAGLGKVVVTAKDAFVGKAGLEERARESGRVLVGLSAEGRRAGRAGYAVLAVDEHGEEIVGEVTSGALSPTLGHPIAMAFVDPAHAEVGTALAIDVRGTRIPATVTALPFYRRSTS